MYTPPEEGWLRDVLAAYSSEEVKHVSLHFVLLQTLHVGRVAAGDKQFHHRPLAMDAEQGHHTVKPRLSKRAR